MAVPKPVALFPTLKEIKSVNFDEFVDLKSFLDDGPEWRMQHWLWGQKFLSYISRTKSEHTYGRFRTEVERFLQWVFLFKNKPMDSYRKADILDYADFCWKPPTSWICLSNTEKFEYRNSEYKQNKKWAPFRLSIPKNSDPESKPDKKKYKPSQQTLTASFVAVVAFYNYLMNEEHLYGNPAQTAKKDCRYFIKDAQVKETRRLTNEQWECLFDTVFKLAKQDPIYERSLFVIAALKTLFLRISELSERKDWSPIMSHFWQDSDSNWWLKIYGKGRKLRDVTVPQSFLPYLKRYRIHRELSSLPLPGDNSPIVEKIRGQGGMSARQLSRIVQEIFDKAYESLNESRGEEAALKLKEATTHWLRHTGASMEVERGRALKDLSEDLGHASMATTDTIYVQSENKARAISGQDRKV